MTSKQKKLLAWSDDSRRLLDAVRGTMPGGSEASDSAVVRWSLRAATGGFMETIGSGLNSHVEINNIAQLRPHSGHYQTIGVGSHKLLCGDITDGAVMRLMGNELADVIYSDPPWGPGNQQYWHTMRVRGSKPRTSWPDFLKAFCEVVAAHRAPDAPVFVEMGLRWLDELDGAMREVGLQFQQRWHILYGSKKDPNQNAVTLYGPVRVSIQLPEPPFGEPVTRAILSAVVKPGITVLDPCTGFGMTARVTHKLGGMFRGCEMNAARLARAEDWLRRHGS